MQTNVRQSNWGKRIKKSIQKIKNDSRMTMIFKNREYIMYYFIIPGYKFGNIDKIKIFLEKYVIKIRQKIERD